MTWSTGGDSFVTGGNSISTRYSLGFSMRAATSAVSWPAAMAWAFLDRAPGSRFAFAAFITNSSALALEFDLPLSARSCFSCFSQALSCAARFCCSRVLNVS